MGSPPPLFRKGDTVIYRVRRELGGGQIVGEPEFTAREWWYRVKFANRTSSLVEDDLEAIGDPDRTVDELAKLAEWGTVHAFRQAVVAERFASRRDNRSTVYAFRNQKVLFAPHQYKPLLKFLDCIDRRLLIADEVGLGKTIEAGLILAELRARVDIARVLVVCPSRLCEKWRQEMIRKFDFEFDVLGKSDLERWLDKCREGQGSRSLWGIVSQQTLRREELRERFFADAPQLDLVIVDEAHHARNAGTLTSQLIQGLAGETDAMLLLTATPINLGNQDLFNLLHALRPTEYRDAVVFDTQLQRHAHVRQAVKLVRRQDPEQVMAVSQALRDAFGGADGRIDDPLANHVAQRLQERPPATRREWVDLERDVEELHLLSSILTRTRKRDVVEHVAVRRAQVWKCSWSEEEQRAYCQLLGVEDATEWPAVQMQFGKIQRARWAASCLPAAIGAAVAPDMRAAWEDLYDFDPEDVDEVADAGSEHAAAPRVSGDAKFAKLVEILREIDRSDPQAKVLLFTFFVGTSHYLEAQLNQMGWLAGRIAGDVPTDPRHPERDERAKVVERFQNDPAVRVLVSTEVGSEGLDFQFCHIVVNYDLPWNPMVVEQRIGRIDRFGQKAQVLAIHNLVVEGTVEDRVLLRLYERVGIFERSIGGLEQILGQQVRQLQADFFHGRLTPTEAERRVEEAASAVERQRQATDLLERRQGDLIGHEDYLRDELARIQRLGRHLGGRSLLWIVEGFLEKAHSSARIRSLGEGLYSLLVDEELCRRVGVAVGPEGESEMRQLMRRSGVRFTFDGETAYEGEGDGIVLLNPDHPLVRAAVLVLSDLLRDPRSRVASARLVLAVDADPELPGGLVFLTSFRQEVISARSRSHIVAVGWAEDRGLLRDDAAERLLHLVSELGETPSPSMIPPPLPGPVWDQMIEAARQANRALEQRERLENETRVERRRQQLAAEFARRIAGIEQKIETVRARGRENRILALFEAQLSKQLNERDRKLKDLEGARAVSVALSEPLVFCAVLVSRSEGGVA